MKRFFSSLADRSAMLARVGAVFVRCMALFACFSLTFRERRISKLLAALTLSAAVVSISGCHPCSILPNCGPEVAHAEAFVGDDGMVYIDLLERKKGQSIDFSSISVSRVKPEYNFEIYWEASKFDNWYRYFEAWKADNSFKIPDGFPIRYGETIGVKTIKPPVAMGNGTYAIGGEFYFFDKKGRQVGRIRGRFTYSNGTVQNLR